MRKHKSSWPFLEPVNKEDVPDYYDIIKDPIGLEIKYFFINNSLILDIKAIDRKTQNNEYKDKDSFLSDIKVLLTNARVYN